MRTSSRLAAVMVAALALVAVACSSTSTSSSTISDEPGKVVGYAPSPVREVGRKSLPDYATDPNGVTFPFKAAPGDLLVVYFGYLTCPDICPVTMADTAAGLAEMSPALAHRVEIAFATVDIERDTGPRLNEYLAHFFPGATIHSLRAADSYALNGASYEFGAQWQVDPHEPGAITYGVAHSGSTYVVDDTGHLVWALPFGATGPDVAATLTQLFAATYPNS